MQYKQFLQWGSEHDLYPYTSWCYDFIRTLYYINELLRNKQKNI